MKLVSLADVELALCEIELLTPVPVGPTKVELALMEKLELGPVVSGPTVAEVIGAE